MSIPALANYLDVTIPGYEASTILFDIANGVLQDLGQPNPSTLATLVGQPATLHKDFTIPSYFQAVENTIEKLLVSEGIPVLYSFAENYANVLANSINLSNINDSKSLCNSILNGFVTFIQTLGHDFVEKSELLSQVFNDEATALQNGEIY